MLQIPIPFTVGGSWVTSGEFVSIEYLIGEPSDLSFIIEPRSWLEKLQGLL